MIDCVVMYLQISIVFIIAGIINCAPAISSTSSPPGSHTAVQTRAVNQIDYKVLKKPHHLFIGRCGPDDKVLHQENIILFNDGKSHVVANIAVNVEAKVYITCVKIYDEIPDGAGGYPSFVAGGVGHNFVEFNVMTDYGKGFHFFVQVYGYDLNDKANEV